MYSIFTWKESTRRPPFFLSAVYVKNMGHNHSSLVTKSELESNEYVTKSDLDAKIQTKQTLAFCDVNLLQKTTKDLVGVCPHDYPNNCESENRACLVDRASECTKQDVVKNVEICMQGWLRNKVCDQNGNYCPKNEVKYVGEGYCRPSSMPDDMRMYDGGFGSGSKQYAAVTTAAEMVEQCSTACAQDDSRWKGFIITEQEGAQKGRCWCLPEIEKEACTDSGGTWDNNNPTFYNVYAIKKPDTSCTQCYDFWSENVLRHASEMVFGKINVCGEPAEMGGGWYCDESLCPNGCLNKDEFSRVTDVTNFIQVATDNLNKSLQTPSTIPPSLFYKSASV